MSGWSRRTGGEASSSRSSSSRTPGSSRAVLRRLCGVRQGRPGGRAHRDRGAQPGTAPCAAPSHSAALVPEHLVLGALARPTPSRSGASRVAQARHERRGTLYLHWEGAEALSCENETNGPRLFGVPGTGLLFKDGLHDCVVDGRRDALRASHGTKLGVHHRLQIAAGGSAAVRLRLQRRAAEHPFADFERVLRGRRREADSHPRVVHAPERPASGLRVGFGRREPAGPRLGGVAGVRDRPRRPCLLGAGLPQVAPQLHLVGESEGSRGAQRLPGRIPWPRQHRPLRSQQAIARGGDARPGRRDELDGMYCLDLMRMALELSRENPVYEDLRRSSSSTSSASPPR